MKDVKLIKDNISEAELEHLLNYIKIDKSIREERKTRLTRIFAILWVTGLRVNETVQLTNSLMLELITTGQTKVVAHKQKKEKIIYATTKGIKHLKRIFSDLDNSEKLLLTTERASKTDKLQTNSVIRDVNTYLKKVFPHKTLTSHSFRQSLITELANKGVNVKTIAELISHSDISTTYRYIRPSQVDIKKSLELVR